MLILPRRYPYIQHGEFTRLLSADNSLTCQTVGEWENRFAAYIGLNHGIAVGSGRHAMRMILAALDLPPDSEIIIPAYTLKDLLPLIKGLGLVPVPADIDPQTWNVSAETIRLRITDRTSAVLTLHLFGNPCPMPEIIELCQAYNLKCIEDCAHSAGSTIAGQQTGSFGDASFFSFETIKPINTYGGGMVVTNSSPIAHRIRKQPQDLIPPNLRSKILTAVLERFLFNSGLALLPLALLASDWGNWMMKILYRRIQPAPKGPAGYGCEQARLGLEKLNTLEKRITHRRQLAARLNDLLPVTCRPQFELPSARTNYYFYVIKINGNPRKVRRHLLFQGIDCGVADEIADDCAHILGYDDCPNCENLFKHSLHLPLHEAMEEKQIEKLAQSLRKLV